MQIDCGAPVCFLPKCYLGDLPIRPERVRLQMWNKASLSALGKCKVKVRNPTNNEQYKVDFVIVDNDLTPLLSSVASRKMNLISVQFDNFKAVNVVTQVNHPYFTQFTDAFKDTPGTLPAWDESSLNHWRFHPCNPLCPYPAWVYLSQWWTSASSGCRHHCTCMWMNLPAGSFKCLSLKRDLEFVSVLIQDL